MVDVTWNDLFMLVVYIAFIYIFVNLTMFLYYYLKNKYKNKK